MKTLTFDGKKRSKPTVALEYAAENLKFEAEASRVFIIVTVDDEMVRFYE